MKRKLAGLVFVAVLVLLTSLAASAQARCTREHHRFGQYFLKPGIAHIQALRPAYRIRQRAIQGRPYAGLNLTADQKQKIAQIAKESREKIQPVKQELAAKRIELSKEMRSLNPDRSKIQAAIEDISRLQEKLSLARTDRILDTLAVLTPGQKATLQQNASKWRSENRNMFHKVGMGGFRNSMRKPVVARQNTNEKPCSTNKKPCCADHK